MWVVRKKGGLMLSCFDTNFIITQKYGINKTFYGRWNLDGHNGLDIVPMGKNKSIYSVFGGKLISKYYNKSYGNRIVLWDSRLKIWECHNHFASFSNKIKLGDYIEPETYLGKMGNTGVSFGAHNHFQIAKVDENGKQLNRDNGFLGYTNPLPYLEE
jgi:murein DD-endopeptidase MepM/ murein hydrolase activator NlpD